MNSKSVILIRHAESEFNLAMRLKVNSDKEPKLEEEDLNVKFTPELIDAPLSQNGIK